MKLNSVRIRNFRSIEDVTFDISKIEGTHTYSLIGINESGKSSFLKAISLVDNDDEKVMYPKDFFDESKQIEVSLFYQLEAQDEKNIHDLLTEKGFEKKLVSEVKIENIEICAICNPEVDIQKKVFDRITFRKKIFENYTLQGDTPVAKDPQLAQDDFDLEKYFETTLPQEFWGMAHKVVFWKSDSKHLINEQINLDTFTEDPRNTSIPLLNCFGLAGISQKDISSQINKLKTDPAEINNLQEKLTDKVTAHIKKVWPDHPIKIKFQINNSLLSFLVEDEKVKYRSKTTDQRSDGFRQFISFLLTVSAENATNSLTDSLLLLDEPETHLHPQAQEYLREELIKITRNDKNNIVLYATHSNYMIDKEHIERCYRVSKQQNRRTRVDKILLGKTSYSEVNYEVFGILSSDYHNELYGYLEDTDKAKLDGLPKTKKWKNKKSGNTEDVSLATYIRHTIHHPENNLNAGYTPDELRESVDKLRSIKRNKQ